MYIIYSASVSVSVSIVKFTMAHYIFYSARNFSVVLALAPMNSVKALVRRVHTAKIPAKPFYITTPIFYVNASPHLGHLYSMLLCDVRNRWEQLKPQSSTFFTTGTDEHGLKIQNVAEAQGIDPKTLVDRVSPNFKFLADKVNIKYDRFIRTTDQDHINTVTKFWQLMEAKGLIYKGEHSGWYSISDETFYPESQIELGPDNKMVSKETRNEVKYHSETNYFFKLSQFQAQLIDFIEENPDFIVPKVKYHELLAELKLEKLPDLSVSRPSSRLKWGIQVPNDPDQKIYVWFDALLNYITSCGFPDTFELENGKFNSGNTPWPGVHVIGKDIIRFHCIYWPIFLMAAGIELPKQVLVHSHWLSEGFKMSKSLGNVVDPIETCDYYGEDSLRFFLMEYSNINNDCNYSTKYFNFTRDNLIGKYANVMTRCGGKAFNIERAVARASDGAYEDIDLLIKSHAANSDSILEIKQELIEKLNNLYGAMDIHMKNFENMRAIQLWWSVLEVTNQFLQVSEPWVYNKAIKNSDNLEPLQLLQDYYILLACESVRICSILIQPIIPTLAGKVLDRLDVKILERSSEYVRLFGSAGYGKGANSKSHQLPITRLPPKTENIN